MNDRCDEGDGESLNHDLPDFGFLAEERPVEERKFDAA